MLARQLVLWPEAEPLPTLRDVAVAVKLAGIDGLPEAIRRADQARYQDVRVRSALTRAQGMPFQFALNPYRGCTHACAYCYARKYQRHLELSAGDDFSSVILVKQNAPEVLAAELSRPGWTRETVAVGTATDPYQPIEGSRQITRRCLEALVAADTPFSIVTKGPMVVRDVDVLVKASRAAGCQVFFSVPSVDEDAWARLEPGTAPPLQRLRAARTLLDAGVETAALMMPLVPGITTSRSSIDRTVRAIAEAGVPLTGSCVARLDPGVKEYFLGFLEREYPHLLEGYERLYPRAYVSRRYESDVKAVVSNARRTSGSEPAAKNGAPGLETRRRR
jgi:DNA repair photolyase